MGFVKGILNYG